MTGDKGLSVSKVFLALDFAGQATGYIKRSEAIAWFSFVGVTKDVAVDGPALCSLSSTSMLAGWMGKSLSLLMFNSFGLDHTSR